MDSLHRILSGAPLSPTELRLAGLLVLEWWLMDHLWFLGTLNHWWGL